MKLEVGDLLSIKPYIKNGKMYGDVEADSSHVKLSGKIVSIKRIRDAEYSNGYVLEDGNIISKEMVSHKILLKN